MYDEPLYDDVNKWTYVPIKKLTLLGYQRYAKFAEGLDVYQRKVRTNIRQAQRFMLSDDFVRSAYQASLDFQKVPTWLNLARLPYPRMWVEWDQHVKLDEQAKAGSILHEPDETLVAKRGGFLFEELDADTGMWLASRWEGSIRNGGEAFTSNLNYVVAPEGSAIMRIKPPPGVTSLTEVMTAIRVPQGMGYERAKIDDLIEMMTFGIRPGNVKFDPKEEIIGHIKNRIVTALSPISMHFQTNARKHLSQKEYEEFCQQASFSVQLCVEEDAGILRFITTVLGLLNEAPNIREPKQARAGYRTMGMNKLQYLGHSMIHLKLPKTKPMRFISRLLDHASNERRRNRAHVARGHWRQVEYGTKFRCDHNPTLVENGMGICTKCERIIRWIPAHQRGDASLGWVTHEYTLESN